MHSTYRPEDAAALFGDLSGWWVAGGWAIDLWLGKSTREHEDLDVATLRAQQCIFWQRLTGWDLHFATSPGTLEPLPARGVVPEPLHAVWCRPDAEDPWSFEILLNDSDETRWLFRRDHRVGLPLSDLGRVSAGGIPY